MLFVAGVDRTATTAYGGSVELADFCPYNQEFEWRDSQSTSPRDHGVSHMTVNDSESFD